MKVFLLAAVWSIWNGAFLAFDAVTGQWIFAAAMGVLLVMGLVASIIAWQER